MMGIIHKLIRVNQKNNNDNELTSLSCRQKNNMTTYCPCKLISFVNQENEEITKIDL